MTNANGNQPASDICKLLFVFSLHYLHLLHLHHIEKGAETR